jgi:hypothetical protein
MLWALQQVGCQGSQVPAGTSRNYFDPSIRKIPGPTDNPEPLGPPKDEVSVPYPLHRSADQETECHFGREESHAFTNSTAMGRSDTAMIPITAMLKWSRTKGRFPKKYPAHTKSPTQAMLPAMLKARNVA